jgi:predicted AlkP superfamily phosphohydrolase/phosphomutase
MTKVVAIGLDGLELSQAERLMAAGKMPALRSLRERGMTARLEHGPAGRTGLAWEQFASGLDPEQAHRTSAVEFDPATYEVWQEDARFTPFWEGLGVRTLVFDPPYVALNLAPTTRGIVAWGAHDPGTSFAARPESLGRHVPPYPSHPWTYAVPWSSEARCREMGESFVEALRLRTKAACEMLEQEDDWDLFVVVAGEPHSATEGLWHGVDPDHPASSHPSAAAARKSFEDTYVALDDLVAAVVAAAGDDVCVVAFAMGGMGPNESDVASMFLLGELLHRQAFGSPRAESPAVWHDLPADELTIPEGSSWENTVAGTFPVSGSRAVLALKAVTGRLPSSVQGSLHGLAEKLRKRGSAPVAARHHSISWMPVTRYQDEWREMRAFALPSFYDGRVRVNLEGREAAGTVAGSEYATVCDEIETVVKALRDPRTGEPVVAFVERYEGDDPLAMRSDEADLVVVWQGVFNGFTHPELGRIGPVPFRRTGGHTGPYGTAVITGPGIEPGDIGILSSFAIAPMIGRLLADAPAMEKSAL